MDGPGRSRSQLMVVAVVLAPSIGALSTTFPTSILAAYGLAPQALPRLGISDSVTPEVLPEVVKMP